ncbi:MAG: hypothetical protein K8J08_21735 [Thermoanaerobaculia bacterium]|nr:hypothetical protein [Thermoanaerobaculia bacterium]
MTKDRNIPRRWIAPFFLVGTLMIVATAQAAPPSEIDVKVVGVRAVAKVEGLSTAVFGTSAGTDVALLFSRNGGGIISFDEDASSLELFADDKGKSLLGDSSFNNGFGSFPVIEDGGGHLLLELEAEGQASPGAKSLHAKGKVVVAVSEVTETYRSGKVSLVEDAAIDAGPIPFAVSAVGPPEWGDAALSVTLVADQKIDEVKSIHFLDLQGQPIEFESGSSSSMSMMGTMTVTRQFTFSEKIDAVLVEIEYWGGLRRVEVPFDLTVGIGF